MVVGVLTGIAYGVNWYVSPSLPWYGVAALLLAAPPAAHLKWKHRGYWLGEDHLLTRNGFWGRTVAVVPYYRIQNVIDSRTVFQRRWGVATIVADTAGTGSLTGSDAAAVDFEIEEAEALKETLTERLATAVAERRTGGSDSFEWLDEGGEGAERVGADEESEGVAADEESEGVAADEESEGVAADEDDGAGAGTTATPETPETTASDEAGPDDDARIGSGDAPESPDDERDDDERDDDDAPDIPEDGVVRPDFSPSDRDYSEPAERIDTGEYAVDQNPSDADVAHGPGSDGDREEGTSAGADAEGDGGESGDRSDDGDGPRA
jgi:putative membrane protein